MQKNGVLIPMPTTNHQNSKIIKIIIVTIIAISVIALLSTAFIIFYFKLENNKFEKKIMQPSILIDEQIYSLQQQKDILTFIDNNEIVQIHADNQNTKKTISLLDNETINAFLTPQQEYVVGITNSYELYIKDLQKDIKNIIDNNIESFTLSTINNSILYSKISSYNKEDESMVESLYYYDLDSKKHKLIKNFDIKTEDTFLQFNFTKDESKIIFTQDSGDFGYTYTLFDIKDGTEDIFMNDINFMSLIQSPSYKKIIYSPFDYSYYNTENYLYYDTKSQSETQISFPLATSDYAWSSNEESLVYIDYSNETTKYLTVMKLDLLNNKKNELGFLDRIEFTPNSLYYINNKIFFKNLIDGKFYIIDL